MTRCKRTVSVFRQDYIVSVLKIIRIDRDDNITRLCGIFATLTYIKNCSSKKNCSCIKFHKRDFYFITYLAVKMFKECSSNVSATSIIVCQSAIDGYTFSSITGSFTCVYAVLTYTNTFKR